MGEWGKKVGLGSETLATVTSAADSALVPIDDDGPKQIAKSEFLRQQSITVAGADVTYSLTRCADDAGFKPGFVVRRIGLGGVLRMQSILTSNSSKFAINASGVKQVQMSFASPTGSSVGSSAAEGLAQVTPADAFGDTGNAIPCRCWLAGDATTWTVTIKFPFSTDALTSGTYRVSIGPIAF